MVFKNSFKLLVATGTTLSLMVSFGLYYVTKYNLMSFIVVMVTFTNNF